MADFSESGAGDYERFVEALRTVESVTGYAEIRRPKMEAARSKADQLLAGSRRRRQWVVGVSG